MLRTVHRIWLVMGGKWKPETFCNFVVRHFDFVPDRFNTDQEQNGHVGRQNCKINFLPKITQYDRIEARFGCLGHVFLIGCDEKVVHVAEMLLVMQYTHVGRDLLQTNICSCFVLVLHCY